MERRTSEEVLGSEAGQHGCSAQRYVGSQVSPYGSMVGALPLRADVAEADVRTRPLPRLAAGSIGCQDQIYA